MSWCSQVVVNTIKTLGVVPKHPHVLTHSSSFCLAEISHYTASSRAGEVCVPIIVIAAAVLHLFKVFPPQLPVAFRFQLHILGQVHMM